MAGSAAVGAMLLALIEGMSIMMNKVKYSIFGSSRSLATQDLSLVCDLTTLVPWYFHTLGPLYFGTFILCMFDILPLPSTFLIPKL